MASKTCKEKSVIELLKLRKLLRKEGIPFESIHSEWVGKMYPHLYYPQRENFICSIICHPYAYGYYNGLLEIMGLVEDTEDSVEGYLSAEEVFERIKRHYAESEGK